MRLQLNWNLQPTPQSEPVPIWLLAAIPLEPLLTRHSNSTGPTLSLSMDATSGYPSVCLGVAELPQMKPLTYSAIPLERTSSGT